MQNLDIDKNGHFFEDLGRKKLSWIQKNVESDENGDNPYMFDGINEFDMIFGVHKGRYGVACLNRLVSMIEFDLIDSDFYEYSFKNREGRRDVKMVRVSECKSMIATVHESIICIQKSENYDPTALKTRIEIEAKFPLSEGQYSYLEWSPLNKDSIEKPSFLSLDDKGRLRVHYVKEKAEQIIEPGEVFRGATFSGDGGFIYAINDKQEVCKTDLKGSNIVMKRKVEGLGNPDEVISSHIQQLTPWIFIIGSVMKTDDGASLRPYLHLVREDISDLKEELKIKAFEMPLFEPFDSKKSVIFRTLYLKESGSNKIRFLSFGFDGSEIEIEGITLKNTTLRGVFFMKGEKPENMKGEYQNKQLELKKGPQFIILDSEEDLHVFRYFDSRYSAPTLSLFRRPLSMDEFVEKQAKLKATFQKIRRYRCKSLQLKIEIIQKKKRSKSQIHIKPQEKQKKIGCLKKAASFNLSKLPKTSSLTSNSLFSSKEEKENKTTTNSLFSSKTEEKPTTSGLFSAKPATNSLFSANPSSTKTTENSLFSFKSRPESRNEPLFKPAPAKKFELFNKKSQSTAINLFSANTQNQKTSDDSNKRAMLFLNTLESDVTFKVEDQEFPAHRAILSEKCRFFKNMFSSGMYESHAQVIEISDIKASIFKAFLQYVYKGQVILNEDLAMSLLEFSEKYLIDELKEVCENFLKRTLTVENFFKIFEAACVYEADSLKIRTLLFFQARLKEITQRKEFEDLPKSTYVFMKRIQWNHKMIFDPEFAEILKKETSEKCKIRREIIFNE